MAIDVKICGITDPEMAQIVANSGASHIGFIFFPRSPRNLSIADAMVLSPHIPDGLTRVGVFVDPDDDFLETAIAAIGLDMLQLHGAETVARVDEVKRKFGLPVIKAMPVATRSDVDASHAYVGHSDYILFDAKPPKGQGDGLPGGTGLSFDWSLLSNLPPEMSAEMPWVLSGGLSLDNIAEAIRQTHCRFVDLSSGVEVRPGVKSAAKIKAFMAAIKEASE
jgi:phosphoribosylanthranilate isomerase